MLVVPERACPPPIRATIVIAWNQSREAMVAVRRAMPFLQAGPISVDIVVVDPPAYGPERSDPGGLLCQMLVRHGVQGRGFGAGPHPAPHLGRADRATCATATPTLLVMGAYGHSRFREAILGGATRDMLEKAEVPVLLAH